MRALILADLHGNIDAVVALETWTGGQTPFDAIWVLGDLVDYGGAPREVIDWVRRRASLVVRGNHDHAMATDAACRSSPALLPLSIATRRYFRTHLSHEDLAYLERLPLRHDAVIPGGGRAVFVHACPTDPMYAYVSIASPDAVWCDALRTAGAPRFLFVGHTHEQFVRQVGETTIVNPGSLGLPLDGYPAAAFAVFDNGRVTLYRIPYDSNRAAARIDCLPFEATTRERLVHVIRKGWLLEDGSPNG